MKNMNKDLCMIIMSYIIKNKYKLLDYINDNNDKFYWDNLLLNKNTINFLSRNKEK